jgi:HAD superfamily hydrolase (TIGR01509 family)
MIDWTAVDTALLDMDGTLLDLHFDNYFWKEYLPVHWGERRGLDAQSAREHLLPRLESRKGTLSWYCLDYWSAELEMDIFTLKGDIEHLIRERPLARELLAFLRRSGKRVLMVTNAHEKLLELKMARTGIDSFFDALVSSHRIGMPKEDFRFWGELQALHPFVPARTLLIDDNVDVLRAAASYGIGHLLTIDQPDSQAPARGPCEFQSLGSFADLLGPAGA